MPDQPEPRPPSPIVPITAAIIAVSLMVAVSWWVSRQLPHTGSTPTHTAADEARYDEAEASMAEAMGKELTEFERELTRRQSDVRTICLAITLQAMDDRPIPQTVEEVAKLARVNPDGLATAVYIPPTKESLAGPVLPLFFDAANPEDGNGVVVVGHTDGHATTESDDEVVAALIQLARGEIDEAALERVSRLSRLRAVAEHLFDYTDDHYGLPQQLTVLPDGARRMRLIREDKAVYFPVDFDLLTTEQRKGTPIMFDAPTVDAGEVGVLFADGSTAYVDDAAELAELAQRAKSALGPPTEERANRLSHLRMIGFPLTMYWSENGELPEDPADANTEQVEMPVHLIRPDAVYFRTFDVPVEQVAFVPLMFDAPSVEAGGGQVGVVFINGAASMVTDQSYLDELTQRAQKWSKAKE